jgi:hypothetical protein
MHGSRFDRFAADLASGATRRRVLAGLGLAAMASLIGRAATAQPEEFAACKKQCDATAGEERAACPAQARKSTARRDCRKAVQQRRLECRKVTCAHPEEEPVVETP